MRKRSHEFMQTYIHTYTRLHNVSIMIVGNAVGYPSSNSKQNFLFAFEQMSFVKIMSQTILSIYG